MNVPKKLYRSGEVTQHTGVSRQRLHYYVQLGLVQEAQKTKTGQRLFDESVFEIISRIKDYRQENFTLMEIKEQLRNDPQLKFLFYDNDGCK